MLKKIPGRERDSGAINTKQLNQIVITQIIITFRYHLPDAAAFATTVVIDQAIYVLLWFNASFKKERENKVRIKN